MKFLWIAVLGIAVIWGVGLNARPIALGEMTQGMVEDFIQGKQQDMVVICPEGTVLPLNLSLKGEFLALQEHAPVHVKILKTCWVKCVEGTFLFSLDAKNWKDFSEFFTGKLGASVGIHEQGPFAGVECELLQRS